MGRVADLIRSSTDVTCNLRPSPAAGNVTVGIADTAGMTTSAERALSLTGPWTNIGSTVIGTNGIGLFQDTKPPAGSGFYRAVRA